MQEVVILVLFVGGPCKKLTFYCGYINSTYLVKGINSVLFTSKEKEAVLILSTWSHDMFEVDIYFKVCIVRGKRGGEGRICSFSIISIWVETSDCRTCVLGHLFFSFIKIQRTHYIASSKLHCDAQDETRKWVMPRIIRLLGGKFGRKNRWRKAWEATSFALMWTVQKEKNRKHVRELKVLM